MSHKKRPRSPLKYSGISATAAEVQAAFAAAIKACICPACGLEFTDAAVEWGNAWREGYVDRIREDGSDIRDGPFKLKCEMCGRRSMYNIFGSTVSLLPEQASQ
jgi:hypothetical protein